MREYYVKYFRSSIEIEFILMYCVLYTIHFSLLKVEISFRVSLMQSFFGGWLVGSWPLFWALFISFILGTAYSINVRTDLVSI